MLTSRQIIIKLIDDKIITGEEAFTLINDIIQAEMVETYKVLEKKDTEKSNYTWTTLQKVSPSIIDPFSIGSYGSTIAYDNSGTCTNIATSVSGSN